MKLSKAQFRNLKWLHDGGGSGYLDKFSRLICNGETAPQGAWASWLHLLAKGLITGGEGRIEITEFGKRYLHPMREA